MSRSQRRRNDPERVKNGKQARAFRHSGTADLRDAAAKLSRSPRDDDRMQNSDDRLLTSSDSSEEHDGCF